MASYDATIRVGADVSPAERAVGKLNQGLDRIERLSRSALDGLKNVRLNFDTRGAEQQINRLQRGIRSLSQTVQLRIREVFDNPRGGAGSSPTPTPTPSNRPKGSTVQAAGAGLAFANIPGQNIAQAAVAGSLVAGPKGAIAAGITATGVAAAQAGAKVADFYAQVSRSRIALAGVSTSNADYQQSLRGIADVVDRLNLPLRETTENYTRLRAATASVGLGAGQTVEVFKSLASANAALGGNSERLNGILLATTQIFSKGKVSAEELRGQLGERLAGAFADFAKASGKSTAELDAALQKGEVSLKDFLAFAEYIGKKYGKNAELMAKSSESAGDRLKTAWEKLQVAIGPLLQSIGATIQNWATATVNALTPVIQKITDLLGLSRKAQNDRLYAVRGEITRKEQELAGMPPGNFTSTGLRDTEGRLIGGGVDIRARLRSEIASLKKEATQLEQALKPASTGGDKPTKPDLDGGVDLEKELKTRSELRQLAIQQALIDGERGLIGKDQLSQLEGQAQVMKQLLGLTLADIRAEGGPLQKARTALAVSEYQTQLAKLNEEAKDLQDEINGVGLEASKLRRDLLGGQMAPTESPLQTALREVKQELQDADNKAEQLLNKLNKLGGTNPETAAARTTLGNLRGDIASTDPNKLASQRLAQGDISSLEEQVRQLQRGSAELSTLDLLMIKYGADWEKLDPTVKGHLTDLARTKDALTAMQFQQQQLNDAINGTGQALTEGIGSAIDALINKTQSWQGVLAGVLRQVAGLLFKAGLNALGGNDGVGLFSILSGNFGGARASGGPVTGGTPYLVGEQGPELFVPGRSGEIVSNGALSTTGGGGSVVSNVYVTVNNDGSTTAKADGSSTDRETTLRLARMIEATTLATINREKRPGGALSR